MNTEDIIRMAREAGAYCHHGDFNMGHSYELQPDQLERFAALVAAAEREACARLVEDLGIDGYGTLAIAAAIRARGQIVAEISQKDLLKNSANLVQVG